MVWKKKAARRLAIDDMRRYQKKREPKIVRLVDDWWDRLLAAIFKGDLSSEVSRYKQGESSLDYLFNSVGALLWGALFPILTMISAHFLSTEQAGLFSLAFVIANLLQNIALYAVRTFQVSDINEAESFNSYLIHRFICLALMLIPGFVWFALKGYTSTMLSVCIACLSFRAIDSFADVFEGRLQQCQKLYLAGLSQSIRCAASILLFALVLALSKSLVAASIAMALCAAISLIFFTIPLSLFESPKSRRFELDEFKEIFVECAPSFFALFFFALIEAIPKFVMEGRLSFDSQLYFNALYFPAQAILMMVGLIYKPQLVRLSAIWQKAEQRKRFDLVVGVIVLICVAITLAMLIFTKFIGIGLNSILYAADFEPLRAQAYMMIIAGGLSALVDFLCQVITVCRLPSKMGHIFGAGTIFVLAASFILIYIIGFNGAVLSYLLSMIFLAALMLVHYAQLRARS